MPTSYPHTLSRRERLRRTLLPLTPIGTMPDEIEFCTPAAPPERAMLEAFNTAYNEYVAALGARRRAFEAEMKQRLRELEQAAELIEIKAEDSEYVPVVLGVMGQGPSLGKVDND